MFVKHARASSDPLPLRHGPMVACFASILTLSLIRLDRGTASWRTPTVAANDTPLLTQMMVQGGGDS